MVFNSRPIFIGSRYGQDEDLTFSDTAVDHFHGQLRWQDTKWVSYVAVQVEYVILDGWSCRRPSSGTMVFQSSYVRDLVVIVAGMLLTSPSAALEVYVRRDRVYPLMSRGGGRR